MKRITSTFAVFLIGLFLTPTETSAQAGEVSLEARGGYNVTVGEFQDGGAESRFGFGADLIVGLTRSISAYGGWGRDQFDCDGCGSDDFIRSQGFEGGLKFTVRREMAVFPWVRAGIIYHDLSGEISQLPFESDSNWGYQAAGGVDVPLTEWFTLSPTVRFNAWSVDVDFETPIPFLEGDPEQGVRYLSFDIVGRVDFPTNR